MPNQNDENKTREQLLAELDELRRQLEGRDEASDREGPPSQPALARPITRRTALSTWVAPVILSIPLAAASRTRTAWAQGPVLPTPMVPPTPRPVLPTPMPALPPTVFPTLVPTSFPTLASFEAPLVSSAGLAAAAAALGGLGAERLARAAKGGPAAAGEPSGRCDDDSQDEDGSK